ncbi:hypothetical protein DENIS_1528 [Desulfonema ishimotonii]|uniref:SWIM-type domain-containing protein n=1 Tax=Desulfonema ishimotonii TaxID=45657 RepID=A0A401FUD4_9BACT|nr:hypothetical protein [Desulfonema ishimotonii]GBC60571.1 hypothetical protein DENIS_1528 [Desulfonema ishimotonii]
MADTGKIREWIIGLSDDYIVEWANKGLLRRGRKLAQKAGEGDFDIADDRIIGHLDGYAQTVDGVGFEHLRCDCPAAETCHHLTAFLLALRDRLPQTCPETPASDETDKNGSDARPWLIPDAGEREKMLGRSVIRRAFRLMMQSVPVEVTENSDGLVAVVREKEVRTVRIPRSGGLDGAICSCKARQCVHKALAVLTVCRENGLIKPEEMATDALTPEQGGVIGQIENWLRSLLIQGVGNVSVSQIEQGESLATLARQADLPRIASQIKSVHQWLTDDQARAAHVRPDVLRFRLARIAAHLSALKTLPLPQPMQTLAGVHSRSYRIVHRLHLTGVGAEIWESPTGYCGFTLYLYAPDQKSWYRHTQARPLAFAGENGWRPADEFRRNSWAGGAKYQAIPGASVEMVQGWVSPDLRLSAREGTRINGPIPLEDFGNLPVFEDFPELAATYARFLSGNIFSDERFMPVIIAAPSFEKAAFDPYQQLWSRTVTDRAGFPVHLRLELARAHAQQAVRVLENIDRSDALPRIFGLLSQRDGEMVLRPVSISIKTPSQWRHLSMAEGES